MFIRYVSLLKLVLLLASLPCLKAHCQTSVDLDEDCLKWFDSLIGLKNTGLINGFTYVNAYVTKEGFDQYYKSPEFLVGDLCYDNQMYFDVNLLYDLYADELILGFSDNNLLYSIKLVKDKVQSFSIDSKYFVGFWDSNKHDYGFYEVLFQEERGVFYKRYRKKMSKHVESGRLYYSFLEKRSYFLNKKGLLFKLDNKKSISRLYPSKKKEINKYFSRYSYLRKSNEDQFMVGLLKEVVFVR